jgi:hypothetical protein
MNDLVEFLRARFNEDEQGARDAFSGQADPENGWGAERPEGYRQMAITPHVGIIHEAVQADHIVRWNPARVLREVEAKRRIIAEHQIVPGPPQPPGGPDYGCKTCHDHSEYGVGGFGYCTTLRLLALPYADHPEFREEWKP